MLRRFQRRDNQTEPLFASDSMSGGRLLVLRFAAMVLLPLALAGCVGAGGGGVATEVATTVSRDAGERRMLDACVYGLYAQRGSSEGVVTQCDCAARRAMESVPGDEFGLTRSGDLLAEQRNALESGIQACARS